MSGTPQPVVTVAIPTHNRAQLLSRAIENALDQTLDAIEIFVLDDESSDETPEVVRSFGDPRVHYARHEPRLGMVGNWNHSFEVGGCELVVMLHDDDLLHPEFLEKAVAMFETAPDAGFVYSNYLPVDGDGNPIRGPILHLQDHDVVMSADEAVERLIRHNEPSWPSILWRRAAVREVGGFVGTYPYSMSWEMWIKLAAAYPVGYLSDTLGFWTIHGEDQFSVAFDAETLALARERHEMLRVTIPALPLGEGRKAELMEIGLKSLAETQLVTAWDAANAGDRTRARQEARYALEIDPRVKFRSPQLVAAAYLGSYLPTGALRALDRLRKPARRLFRRF